MSNTAIDNFITLLKNDSLQLPKMLLQLTSSDMETAAASIKKMENLAEKILYVKAHHKNKITEMKPNGNWKSVWYKTYIYVEGKRKAVEATTEEKVYDKLYELLKKDITLEQAFEMLMEYKISCLHRDDHTIQTDRGNFAHVSKKIRETKINELTENFRPERIFTADRCAIKIGMAEMDAFSETPTPVVIDEAVKLAAKFSTENSTDFVNGILAVYSKSRKV